MRWLMACAAIVAASVMLATPCNAAAVTRSGGKVAAIQNTNGQSEVFLIGKTGQLYTNYQITFGGSAWSGWQSLGGSWPDQDSIATADDNGYAYVFLIGNNGQLYYSYQQNSESWSGWHSLGGQFSNEDSIGLGPDEDGPYSSVQVFVIGSNHQLYTNWQTGSGGGAAWSGWLALGGNWPFQDTIGVGNDQNGLLKVFLIGNTTQLYTAQQAFAPISPWSYQSWTGWTSLGGSWPSQDSVAVGNVQGALSVFLIGNTKQLYKSQANGSSWSGWSSLGGSWPNQDSIALDTNGNAQVYLSGNTTQLYTANTNDGNWSNWISLGGSWPGTDSIGLTDNNGQSQVFLVGKTSQLYTAWETAQGGNWISWIPLGGTWPAQ